MEWMKNSNFKWKFKMRNLGYDLTWTLSSNWRFPIELLGKFEFDYDIEIDVS